MKPETIAFLCLLIVFVVVHITVRVCALYRMRGTELFWPFLVYFVIRDASLFLMLSGLLLMGQPERRWVGGALAASGVVLRLTSHRRLRRHLPPP